MSAEKKGLFVAVVGPSGAGKDTLMRAVAARLSDRPDIRFAQRVITRDADPDNEDHEVLSRSEFADARKDGAFCLDWEAHGLCYSLRREAADHVASGGTMVANLSRAVLSEAASRFTRMDVLEITARPEIRVERLLARGRETADDIRSRVAREMPISVPNLPGRIVTIDNSGQLDDAVDALEAYLAGAKSAS
ncbi:phosphonate metabolism protein/1,5-bisphosphokinase (PRPP-forming) PhnN [Neorhizobium sp. JUb45]|uniref:phosphonate metabolism protein/1,5-bisphosphokinase (PRPP-forming) PhnN n=1 Tax=unclassified Neorhizobium TaxID=2629175 RepID=UPI0010443DCE|nr:phosphonate metabolism protein/1,5-bisphosphokinase (PRPP-forming) PhnN [Neorhizobium sp. JUb45]TCR03272.1 ribose 1,5-bisphosphokinase [Neorhizobium sp. JUb45]